MILLIYLLVQIISFTFAENSEHKLAQAVPIDSVNNGESLYEHCALD